MPAAIARDIVYFYPRSPCGERLGFGVSAVVLIRISIHALLAESDSFGLVFDTPCSYFYPRSPCGERQKDMKALEQKYLISIHALLAESDRFYRCPLHPLRVFLSTLSLRRATVNLSTVQTGI